MDPGSLGHVSVEWFSTVSPEGKDTDPPAYFVTVLVQSDTRPDVTEFTQVSYYTMTLGETTGNEISVTLARRSSETVGFTWFYANLLRDPAGRPRSWSEDFQWELMAGLDYSHDSITDLDQKSGWSVGLSDTWGPPFRAELPKSVSAYDFRLYLLPVPVDPSTLTKTYWTTELLAQTKRKDLDGNSGCWRIVYVVTKIEHVDGSNPYRYDGKLDVPTVYRLSGS